MRSSEFSLTETRNSLLAYLKQQFPTWPDYIIRDLLYQQAKTYVTNQKEFANWLGMTKKDFGKVTWRLEKLPITLDIFTPKTQQMIQSREGGSSNPFQVPKDAERHAQQLKMIQQQGVRTEPIIVAKLNNGYDLIEGWHRTIQHLKVFPEGYTGPAWVGYGATYTSEIMGQGLAEAEAATKNSNDIWRQLKAAGYKYVASGADATVWAKDESHVIKILMPEDLGNKAEQVFRKFYEIALKYQDLPCLPRVNEVNTIDINGKDYTQIEMERLRPIEKGTFMEGVIWFFSDFCQAQEPWNRVDHAMGLTDTWEYYPHAKGSKTIANVFTRQWQDLMYNKQAYSMYRQLYNVMKLLYTTGTINRYGWDLHTANVMQRTNGQPVIIDPWFSEGTS
jgi:hypothetical protein